MAQQCNQYANNIHRYLSGNSPSAIVALESMESRLFLSTSQHSDVWDVGSPISAAAGATSLTMAVAPQAYNSGLRGEYYNNKDLTNLALVRTDASINFDWGWESPDKSIRASTFSERWTGYIQPRYSETYTFTTRSDDGVRVWINNQLVIDQWNDHAPSEHSGQITLEAGKKYDFRMEHYEKTGVAVAELYWQSASQQRQLVPAAAFFTKSDSTTPLPPVEPTQPVPPPTKPVEPPPTKPVEPPPPTKPVEPPLPVAPNAPGGLNASAVSTSQINLTWVDRSTNESRFVIERAIEGQNYLRLASVSANTTTYSDKALAEGTKYSYRVLAANDGGNSAFSAAADATTKTTPTPPPVTPTPPTNPNPTPPTYPPVPTGPVTYSGPITITKGGVYTGNWESNDAKRAAVEIDTTEAVTIINSNIRGRGHLIQSSVSGANVTVLNTAGYALNPNVSGRSPGRFVNAEFFNKIDVENCYMEGTAGMYFYKGGDITVLYNAAKNIDGRASDGHGGFSTNDSDSDLVQFVQLNDIHEQQVEIAWNQVINEPGKSRAEDVISIYGSSGTANRPISVHDNYIQGSYPSDPANDGFSGGGIMVGDGGGCGYIVAYNNTVVSTSNYGIAISAGHDNKVYNNRIVSAGILPDGRRIDSQNVGLYVWNAGGDGNFARNSATDNLIGWSNGNGGRNDSWTPDGSVSNNQGMSGSITLATEANELKLWQAKLNSAGFIVGVKK
ncbi:MAG: fibronectin type III domain-containing protein [Phycisphaerales bacterium]|jgi:hypothetical protein|nr:fibronectin type III domain-containing protein [Phycisphaerales bacterium]